jgi:hypothetical protein|tara:strand:- start:763 stop:1821 length:1059 start_codon:yes stop_codon:yes gene_type:complete
MYYFVTSSKDSTIYLQQPGQNTGLDEILEISKIYYGNLKDISRSLIKFDTTPLSQSIASGEVTMSSAELILRECESSEIASEYTIYAYPVSQSWDVGIGTRFDKITTDGVTWNTRKTSTNWLIGSASLESSGSYNGKGGMWYTASNSSQVFSYDSSDITMNVLAPITDWISGSIPNEGFILKHDSSKENDTIDYGQLKFFSKETNTIYQPKVRIGWDDSLFVTGSLTALTADDVHVTFKRLKTRYKVGSKPEIRVFGREKYPLKTYANEYSYTDVYYLPTSSYYQIKDIITDEVIVPFGDYTKLSCDSNGNYFKLNLTNWEYNRDYYIEIKIDRDGVIEYFIDKDLTFTIEK